MTICNHQGIKCYNCNSTIPSNISCFPRRLQDVTLFFFQDLLKTSWKVLKTYLQYVLYVFLKCLRDVLQGVFKTFSRRLQDVFKTCLQDVLQLCLQDVLEDKKMLHWRRLQYVFTKTNVCWDRTTKKICALIISPA